MRRGAGVGAAGVVLLAALVTQAQPAGEDARAAARALGYEGMTAYKAGRYAEALDKLQRAYSAVKVPSLGLWTARSLERTGRLVEAADRYLEVTRLAAEAGDEELQRAAVNAAAKERRELMPRIPTLQVRVQGRTRESVEVTLDGASVPPDRLGVAQRVNPGQHQVTGVSGQQRLVESVTLAEGDRRSVVLSFSADRGAAPGVAPAPAPPPPQANPVAATPPPTAPVASAPPPATQSGSSAEEETGMASRGAARTQRTFGWVGIALAGSGVVIGSLAGSLMLLNKRELDDGDCLDRVCGPAEHDRVTEYNIERTISTVAFVVAGVGLVGGTLLLVTAPAIDDDSEPAVAAWVGVGSAGVAGRF